MTNSVLCFSRSQSHLIKFNETILKQINYFEFICVNYPLRFADINRWKYITYKIVYQIVQYNLLILTNIYMRNLFMNQNLFIT